MTSGVLPDIASFIGNSVSEGDFKVALSKFYDYVKDSDSTPIGTIIAFGGDSIPDGYLLCDGSSLSTESYSELYGVIGNLYGGGGRRYLIFPICLIDSYRVH